MGGEHHVSFHNNFNFPCYYIHENYYIHSMIPSQEDMIIWPKIKQEILFFLESCYDYILDDNNIDIYILKHCSRNIKSWKGPECINLYWSHRDDDNIVGWIYHDITKLLMLAYPKKICACYDRCQYYKEYPGQEWDMCTFEFGEYLKMPKFIIYKPKDIDINVDTIFYESKYLTKIITPDYPFDIYYVIKNNIYIPYNIKFLIINFPLEIVNLICQYIYRIYSRRKL